MEVIIGHLVWKHNTSVRGLTIGQLVPPGHPHTARVKHTTLWCIWTGLIHVLQEIKSRLVGGPGASAAGGSSSEGLKQPSVGPPLHQGRRGMIPPHLLLEHGALDSWSPGRGAAGLGCSRLDPGKASSRRLPVAVAALPPRSSAGRRCRSGGASVEVAVLYRGWWLQCGFGQPFHVPSWSEEPHIGRQCGRVSPHHTPPKWLLLGALRHRTQVDVVQDV